MEQNIKGPIPDVLTLKLSQTMEKLSNGTSPLAVAVASPRTPVVRRNEVDLYADKANRIVVRHRHGDVVAVLEIVSPGSKSSRAELRTLIEKSAALLRPGIHLLVVDLLPPSKRDSHGPPKAIWDEFGEEELELPPDKPLRLGALGTGPPRVADGEPLAVGDGLLPMPMFLKPEYYVPAPLEATYQATWSLFPAPLKELLESPAPPR
ncbi:MAG TPA: DUF4058 family protein [Gemmataceae bacterium]|nr:DUF4058 family protein [Gemmataceae bacterium]